MSSLVANNYDGLTIISSGCKFPTVYVCQNENWLAVDKVIAKIIRLNFFGPTPY